ncbi:MAG: FAD-dependent monooxygenase, partial [Micromonosporaceae bacterium]
MTNTASTNGSSAEMPHDVPVLIVGGSLVGLTTALLLAARGVRALAVERHAGTAIHPRAGHFQIRTTEILREMGLEDEVRQRSRETYDPEGGIIAVESLAGKELARFVSNLNVGVDDRSPTGRIFIDQDVLEPILRRRAEELGATLRYRSEMTSFEQDADGVRAVIRDLDRGKESEVRAKYLVAADGNRSRVRHALGILLCQVIDLAIMITLIVRVDWWIAFFALAGLFLSYAYAAPP